MTLADSPATLCAALRDDADQVRANGHGMAWLAVVPGNGRARTFYARAGWVDEGPFDYPASVEGRSIGVPCHRYVKRVANDAR